MPEIPAKEGARPPAVVRFGKYELLATLGQGGMGQVFLARARGPAGFEKLVVVKTIHAHLAGQRQFINLFLDEARLAARISHPNVVQIFELGQVGAIYFMSMEYLVGESLTAVLRAGVTAGRPLEPDVAAAIVAEAAAGLHAAHDLKALNGKPLEVVHRDVSPGNIFVQYEGAVKVVDFGVAKARDRASHTVQGEVKGKFAYMSPEQVKQQPVDRRSDVFSLGVVLWESLAMRRLFRADSPAATVMAIVEGNPKPPSHYRPGLPDALDRIALRALARDPKDRWQTAEDLHDALRDYLHEARRRVGAREIKQLMQGLFAERIAARQELLQSVAALGDVPAVVDAVVASEGEAAPGEGSESSSLRLPWSVEELSHAGAAGLLTSSGASEESEDTNAPTEIAVDFGKTTEWSRAGAVDDRTYGLPDETDGRTVEMVPRAPAEARAVDVENAEAVPPVRRGRGLWLAVAGAAVALLSALALFAAGVFDGGVDEGEGSDERVAARDKRDTKDTKDTEHAKDPGEPPATAEVGPRTAAPASAAPDTVAPATDAPATARADAPRTAKAPATAAVKHPPPETARPEPKPTGRLFLATDPPSTVYLGKRKLGDTPLVGVTVPAGSLTLSAAPKGGGARVSFKVVVDADKDTRLLHKLE